MLYLPNLLMYIYCRPAFMDSELNAKKITIIIYTCYVWLCIQ
ncbi:hypothetical protein SAMN05421579_1032 [Xenorhabdus japonica]|uniref:Uncharacterized protein n=1 Tax=Xenorhabdus japonica TaxID=53341 RepID=A0A1I4YS31_9GAMM|nr:hypothetical protein SAMN05421579_1032 [Xenorhabdus japonica]